VREFYTHLEVVQDEDNGIVLQSTIEGHVFQIDPHVIIRILGVPVLHISASPFNEVVEPPTLELKRTSEFVPFLPHIACSRRLFDTIYGPLFVRVT